MVKQFTLKYLRSWRFVRAIWHGSDSILRRITRIYARLCTIHTESSVCATKVVPVKYTWALESVNNTEKPYI